MKSRLTMASMHDMQVTMTTAKFIKKHLTCSICLEEFSDPRRLTCGHLYCLMCLQGHINVTAGDRYIRRGTVLMTGFSCPECRKTIRIPRPWEPKDRWARQINADFRTANLQADIREGAIVLTDLSGCGHAEDRVDALRFNTRSVHVQTEPVDARTEDIGLKASHKQVQAEAVGRRAKPQQEPPQKKKPQVVKQKKTKTSLKKPTSLITRGEYVRVVSLFEDEPPPELFDLVVLVQGENRIIVTFDLQKNEILTFTLNKAMGVSNTNNLHLGCKPWRICKVSKTQVALTVSDPNGILTCSVGTDITVDQLIPTRKHYDGITMMSEGIFVVTTRSNVDVLNDNGRVLREFKISSPAAEYTDNSYVACTPNQNIIVTDCAGKAVSCVTQAGKVAWTKKMDPLGVACDAGGRIYIVDAKAEMVTMFTGRGQFISRILEPSEIFSTPSGIAVDDTGFFYVICNFKDISIWDLCSSPDEF